MSLDFHMRFPKRALPVASFLLGSLITSAPSGQIGGNCDPFEGLGPDAPGDLGCLPEPASGDFKALAGGDLDADHMPEIVTIRGTTLYFVRGSQYIGDPTFSQEVVGEVVFDACYSASAAGGGPAFLFTTPAGLKILTLDASGTAVVSLVNGSPEWMGAQEVRVGKANGDVPAAFGVSQDRRSLFVSPGFSSGTPTPIFTYVSATVTDFVLLGWENTANGDELGILTSNGVQIRSQTSTTPIVGRSGVVAGDAIAAVKSPNKSDAFVWITSDSAGLQSLLVFNAQLSPVYQIQMSSIGVPVSSVTAADLNADGHEDLLLSSTSSYLIHTVENNAKGNTWAGAFTTLWTKQVDMSVGAPGSQPNTGQVLAMPLWNFSNPSGRKLPDIALCLPHLNKIRRYPFAYQFPGGNTSNAQWMDLVREHDFQSAVYNGCETSPAQWTYTVGNGWPGVTPNAIQVQFFPYAVSLPSGPAVAIQSGRSNRIYRFEDASDPATIDVNGKVIPLDEVENPINRVFYVRFRPVRVSGTTVLEAWRWSIASMTTSELAQIWLENRPQAGEVVPTTVSCLSLLPPQAGSGGKVIVAPILQGDFPQPGLSVPPVTWHLILPN